MVRTQKTYGVSLGDELDHRRLARPGQSYWENNAWLIRGEANGEELCLWVAAYIITKGQDFLADCIVLQTLFMGGPYSPGEKQSMHDNDFTLAGWKQAEWLDPAALSVAKGPGQVVWRIGDRQFVASPPAWEIKGSHGGVTLDLKMQASCPPFWFTAATAQPQDLHKHYQAHCRAQGTIEARGKRYHYNGYASHERTAIAGAGRLGQGTATETGVKYQHGFTDQVSCWVSVNPSRNSGRVRVAAEGKVLEYVYPGQVEVHDLALWTDPRSWMTVPYKWHVHAASRQGILDLAAASYARAYYVWAFTKEAYNILYWQMADAQGSFTFPSGKRLLIENMKYVAHVNRVFYR